MKSKIAKRLLVSILSASMVFQMNIPAVYAANSGNTPQVESVTNSIFANGVPLLIEEGSNGNTRIKYYDGNNYVDWKEGDYQYYQVYGGTGFGYVNEPVQSTSITMTGGKVGRIYAGGKGKVNVNENVKGDANVTITGGTVALVLCGGDSSSIGGNTTITITGGNISTSVQLGGSEYDKIVGNANITITGGTVEKLGKGIYSTILGKKTGIITTTIVDFTSFDNCFLKTGDNTYIAKGTITLPSDFDFTLPTGATLTVQEGAVITNQGKITLNGTMVNNGTFTNNGAVNNEGGSYSGSGTWNGNAIEDLNLIVSTAKEITDSSVKFTVNCNKDATVYYLASETPISDTSTLETKGNSQSISANTDTDIALANLTDNTSYTYYMVAKAGEKFTDIKTVSFTTLQKSPLSGTGTQMDPYIIKTDVDLAYLGNSVRAGQNYSGKYFKLNNDITYSSMPIGCFSENGNINSPFCGNFDGAGHTVTLVMTNTSSGMEQAVALFGYLGNGAVVENINTTGTITSSGKYSGGIVGAARDGAVNISNCWSNVEMNFTTGGDATYGGIVGLINNSGNVTMTNCCFTGKIITSSVKGLEGVGGLCGWNSDTLNAANCYVDASFGSGTVKGEYMARNGGSFTNCYYNKDKTLTDDGSTSSTGNEAVTSDFASGKIAWLLQKGQSNSDVQVWGQTLTGDIKDSDPVLSSDSVKAVHKVSYYQDNKELENIRSYVNSSMTLANFTLTEEEINEGYKYNFQITSGTATLDTTNNQLNDIGGDVIVTVTKGIFYTIKTQSANSTLGTVGEGGTYAAGAAATLTAEPRIGCKFIKWTSDAEGNTTVSTDKTLTITINNSSTYYAWFAPDKYKLTVGDFNSSAGTVSGVKEEGYSYNEEATLTAEANTGYAFDGWKNEYGVTVATSPTFSFNVLGNMTITPIFTQIEENTTYYTAAFYHQAGNLLKSEKVAENGTIAPPNTPSKIGYDFIGWSTDGINAVELNKDGSITITSNMIFKPLFRVKEVNYSLTVNGIVQASYAPLSSVTAQVAEADIPEGKQFAYWSDKDGNVVSYSNPYNFSITGNIELTAVYENSTKPVIKKPTITLSAPTYELVSTGKHKMIWYAVMDLPEGYTLVESGILRVVSVTPQTNEQMTFDSEGIYRRIIQVSNSIPNQYYYSVAATDGKGVSVRAYIVIRNKDGNLETIFSDVQYGCYSGS